jgi:RNA polymerase sigma-70 factor, ECF subfamily
MSEQSDEEIAARVADGESAAFDHLIERYEAKIARYGRRFLFDGDDAKDLLQDIFIKAYVNIKDFDTSRKFSAWIYRIAHNEFINAIKKRTRTSTMSLDLDADVLLPHLVSDDTADKEANVHEMRAVLDKSLKEIPIKYKEPLILYYFEDMDYKQISDVLSIPVATVGVRLKRGKAMLKTAVVEVAPEASITHQ